MRRNSLLRTHFDAHVKHAADADGLIELLLRSTQLDEDYGKKMSINLVSSPLSQHGEDALAWNLAGRSKTGFFIEAGAHDGVSLSNTCFLEQIGWTGLLVEAHPELVAKCRRSRPRSVVVHAALGRDEGPLTCEFQMVIGSGGVDALSFSSASDLHRERIEREGGKIEAVTVPCTSLNKLLTKISPPSVDFVSLDVEGAEVLVLSGFDLDKWKPRILAIEDNSNGQDLAIRHFMAGKGYKRILRLACNDFYVRSI